MINWLRRLFWRGRHRTHGRRRAGQAVAVDVSRDAQLLCVVCALVLLEGEPGPELADWCLRMLAEPGPSAR